MRKQPTVIEESRGNTRRGEGLIYFPTGAPYYRSNDYSALSGMANWSGFFSRLLQGSMGRAPEFVREVVNLLDLGNRNYLLSAELTPGSEQRISSARLYTATGMARENLVMLGEQTASVSPDGEGAYLVESTWDHFSATEPSRGPSKPFVAVDVLGGGALVVHELENGCCLKANVKSVLEGQVVTLTETLSGESCRSSVRAAVGPHSRHLHPPGRHRGGRALEGGPRVSGDGVLTTLRLRAVRDR